jgi:NTP pyrophosphatase (non-canonical NTP hydrolase)
MEITAETVGRLPLDEFVKAVRMIYANQDQSRSVWDVWLHANHHAATIGEELRKQKPGKKLLDEIADFSMWLFTFAVKIHDRSHPTRRPTWGYEETTSNTNLSFSDVIWNKYPGTCPVCFSRRTAPGWSVQDLGKSCDCLIYDVESRNQDQKQQRVKSLRKYAAANRRRKPRTVDGWQALFSKIYAANLRHLTLADIGFHLLEEVGEVSDAMVRMYTYSDDSGDQFAEEVVPWRTVWLEEEIADVFSWLLTLVNSLQLMPTIAREFATYLYSEPIGDLFNKKITLSKIIWKRYGNDKSNTFWCQKCKQDICVCTIVFVNDNRKLATFWEFCAPGIPQAT